MNTEQNLSYTKVQNMSELDWIIPLKTFSPFHTQLYGSAGSSAVLAKEEPESEYQVLSLIFVFEAIPTIVFVSRMYFIPSILAMAELNTLS